MNFALLTLSTASISFAIAMVFAGAMDVLKMKIENGLIFFLLFAYAFFSPLAGFGLADISTSLLAALLVFFLSIAFFAMGWIGGGDGKLATVTALWLGADHTMQYLSSVALFGGVLTLCLLVFRGVKLPGGWNDRFWIARLHSPKSGVPYGVALAAAGLFTFRDTVWMASLV